MTRGVVLFLIAGTRGQTSGWSHPSFPEQPFGWPRGTITHKYHYTDPTHPFGTARLHYVTWGDLKSRPPMVLLHSHPRSTVEFKYLFDAMGRIGNPVPFLALDWFGMGGSDEYAAQQFSPPIPTFWSMAETVRSILRAEGVREFSVVGHMQGAHLAIELAGTPYTHDTLVKKMVLINPMILSPKAKRFVDHVYIPAAQKKYNPAADGSQLLAAWDDPSAAPMGPDGKPSSNPTDLLANQEKAVDALRCANTGWQYAAAWSDYNDKNLERMAQLDADVESLFLYGDTYLADAKKYGLDAEFSLATFAQALTHRHNTTIFVPGAGQGMLVQNASFIAPLIADFVSPKLRECGPWPPPCSDAR